MGLWIRVDGQCKKQRTLHWCFFVYTGNITMYTVVTNTGGNLCTLVTLQVVHYTGVGVTGVTGDTYCLSLDKKKHPLNTVFLLVSTLTYH